MSLGEKIEKLKFDTRMRDINLKNGSLEKKELDSELSKLDDCSGNAVNVDFKHELITDLDDQDSH